MIQWTKEDIELEELDDQRSSMSEQTYDKKVGKITGKIYDKAAAEIRKQREAEWEAEAARRNAREEEKARRWRSMDAAQQRAYWEGVGDAHETAERDRREEARKKKPAATARDETLVEIGKLPETEGAK